jgi:hypothetical protein
MTKFEELAHVWGQAKADEFKQRYLDYVEEYLDEDDDELKRLEAANILARVLTADEAEFAEDFYETFDNLGLGNGDIDDFASELSDELLS